MENVHGKKRREYEEGKKKNQEKKNKETILNSLVLE